MPLSPGTEAPDFALRSHKGGTVRLSDFVGRKNVVLAFHPLAFTPVCATQMTTYQAQLPQFAAGDTVVLGVSVDAQPAKTAWAQSLGRVDFDLLSDFHPQGAVAAQYGVYREEDGISERAIFVIDKSGRITWSKVYDIPTQPPVDELFAALQALQ